jgi:hypothetical protein
VIYREIFLMMIQRMESSKQIFIRMPYRSILFHCVDLVFARFSVYVPARLLFALLVVACAVTSCISPVGHPVCSGSCYKIWLTRRMTATAAGSLGRCHPRVRFCLLLWQFPMCSFAASDAPCWMIATEVKSMAHKPASCI